MGFVDFPPAMMLGIEALPTVRASVTQSSLLTLKVYFIFVMGGLFITPLQPNLRDGDENKLDHKLLGW